MTFNSNELAREICIRLKNDPDIPLQQRIAMALEEHLLDQCSYPRKFEHDYHRSKKG